MPVDAPVTNAVRLPAGEAARERDQHRHAGRRGEEVLHGQPQHLGEVTQARFSAVILPVRVGDEADENNSTLRQKMAAAVRPDGNKVYNLATGLSLLVFYVLAMQCMSTLAVVKRETRSWKWPMIQLVYMTGLAYLLSWVVYRIFI